jgi:hypothetical protein
VITNNAEITATNLILMIVRAFFNKVLPSEL